MSQSFDILVAGAGLQGLLTARELRLAGASVALLEAGQPGRQASWAAGGILSPLYPWRYLPSILALSSWSQKAYPALIETLKAETGLDAEWLRSGLLILESEEQQQALEWAQQQGYRLERLDQGQISALEPALAQVPESGLWLPEVAQIRNPRLLKALLLDLERLKVPLLAQRPLESVLVEQGRCQGVRTTQGDIKAGQVVLCTGAWTSGLWPETQTGIKPHIWPMLGQMILLAGKPGLLKTISMRQARYFVPRADGRVLVGSTLEETDFECRTTVAARDELLEVVKARVPALADARVEHQWAGLRPATTHGVPYIGAHPDVSGLYINSGQYRNGLVLAPASARLIADILLQRDPILDPAPYDIQALH